MVVRLEPQTSFEDYYRVYGDRLAELYEDNEAILIPHIPILFDLKFCQRLSFKTSMKKIGTHNGIEKPILKGMDVDHDHVLVHTSPTLPFAVYFHSQIVCFNTQLRAGIKTLFPRYKSLFEANITWRLSETINELMHLDIFGGGAPSRRLRLPPGAPEGMKSMDAHRIKLFINIDTEPRKWRVSWDLKEIVQRLDIEREEDLNLLNFKLSQMKVLELLPYESVEFPTMSAILSNGESRAHQVIYGRRMVAGEFFCDKRDMIDPAKHPLTALPGWFDARDAAKAASQSRDNVPHLCLPKTPSSLI